MNENEENNEQFLERLGISNDHLLDVINSYASNPALNNGKEMKETLIREFDQVYFSLSKEEQRRFLSIATGVFSCQRYPKYSDVYTRS